MRRRESGGSPAAPPPWSSSRRFRLPSRDRQRCRPGTSAAARESRSAPRSRRRRGYAAGAMSLERSRNSGACPTISTRLLSRAVRAGRAFVAVVMANPCHRIRQIGLVAALGREIEKAVDPEQLLDAAGVGGIGVEDVALGVLGEDADAGSLVGRKAAGAIVVRLPAWRDLLWREGDAIVAVEVRFVG